MKTKINLKSQELSKWRLKWKSHQLCNQSTGY